MAASLPPPVSPSDAAVVLPKDHYLHPGAPAEWWWHIGTLKAGDRIFGFEINAAGFTAQGFAFTQIMLTDVASGKHYQRTTLHTALDGFNFATWAEKDVTKDWRVEIGQGQAFITMHAPQADPTRNMTVAAHLIDQKTSTEVHFDLLMSQQGAPFLVWGTGVKKGTPTGDPLKDNNYYYSLTRVDASGTLTIDGEKFAVRGLTWMDHEYGWFGSRGHPVKWILQNAQLDNGWTLANYVTLAGGGLTRDQPVPGTATLQSPEGAMYLAEDVVMTPVGAPWISPDSGNAYFMEFRIEIPSFDATLTVSSLVDSQEFPGPLPGAPSVYEGVATATGTFLGSPVSGTAWNEQAP